MGEKQGIRQKIDGMTRALREQGVDSRRAEQMARNCALRHDGSKHANWRGAGDVQDRRQR